MKWGGRKYSFCGPTKIFAKVFGVRAQIKFKGFK